MCVILSGIESLVQHLEKINTNSNYYRSERCPHCGMAGVWHHGSYNRKPDRGDLDKETLNPIPILRFFCNNCKRTHSVLPECIPPCRWYLWLTQQAVMLLLCAGYSFKTVSNMVIPTRSTCRRWWQKFKDHLALHRDTLSVILYQLGAFDTVNSFWNYCLEQMTLAKAMYFCHLSRINIP